MIIVTPDGAIYGGNGDLMVSLDVAQSLGLRNGDKIDDRMVGKIFSSSMASCLREQAQGKPS